DFLRKRLTTEAQRTRRSFPIDSQRVSEFPRNNKKVVTALQGAHINFRRHPCFLLRSNHRLLSHSPKGVLDQRSLNCRASHARRSFLAASTSNSWTVSYHLMSFGLLAAA